MSPSVNLLKLKRKSCDLKHIFIYPKIKAKKIIKFGEDN
jgi:hypothetical protein